jgi:Ser/Thr protein kinase RdoA (MazF antagonist)
MNVFPANYSTLCPNALAALVKDQYLLNKPQLRLISRGVGDTYLVESGKERYILRAYRNTHRTPEQIKVEIDLLIELKRLGVSVSYPIADESGNCIQTVEAIEGSRQLVLFSYAAGKVVSNLNNLQLQSLGREMAKFHQVSAVFPAGKDRWSYNFETTLFQPLKMAKHPLSQDPEGYAWLQQAVELAKNKINAIGTHNFSMGYCHFDFLPKNFHFDGNAVTFFDFDFMGYGWLVNDIMTYWTHLCLDVHFSRMSQQDADEDYALFIAAYQEIRPISKEELAAVPYLSLGFWLFYMGFHTTHDQFYAFIEPAHLKLRMGLIRKLMERYWN